MIKKFFIIFCFLCFALQASAENFDIENYEVYLKVDQNKVVQVKESILANFTAPSHGIFRDINLTNSTVTDIWVDNERTIEKHGSNLRLKIGSPQHKISGLQHYNISYLHHLYGSNNEFYYNIIGTDWPVNIKKVKFKIELPAPFDSSKVGISIGKYGTKGFDGGAEFSVQDNIIFGETLQNLPPFHGITVRIELPNGFFLIKDNPIEIYVLLAIVLLSLLSFSIWFLYGKDAHITPIVTFYPPKDTFIREAELVCYEKITNKSLIAMIIELAQQGYIAIENQKQKGFTLQKLKDYDGNDMAAHKFMEILFIQYSFGQATTVTQKELEKSRGFYKKCQKIIAQMNGFKTRFFSAASVSSSLKFFMFLLILAIFALTAFSFCHYYIDEQNLAVTIAEMLKVASAVIILRKLGLSYIGITKQLLIPLIPFIFVLYLMTAEMVEMIDQNNVLQVVCGIIGLMTTIVCYIQLPQLNFRGQRVKGQLLGLKKFIEVAEKKRLEMLVEENPQYFYEILPYAYILGVSDKWIKQFESILTIKPKWHSGRNFTQNTFNSFANSMQATTVPTLSNGGITRATSSHGGGGFAGGGRGGGGGGSW